MRLSYSRLNILRQNLKPNFGSDKPPIVPDLIKAWQCLEFVQPTAPDLSKELHCTSTRRRPVISRPDHLLIKVEGATLNPVDRLTLYGYGSSVFGYARWFGRNFGVFGLPSQSGSDCPKSEFPITPGLDFVGRVVGVGPAIESSRFRIGQHVAGATWPFMNTSGSGSLSEYIVCPASFVAPVPDVLKFPDYCTIGYAGLTAWSALVSAGLGPHVSSSKPLVVLITGATGGVGTVAAQLAKIWGSRVHVTCPDDARSRVMMEKMEVEEVIVYPDMPKEGMKYDVIVDCLRPSNLSSLYSADSSNHSISKVCKPSIPPMFDYLKSSSSARYVNLNPPLLAVMDQRGLLAGSFLATNNLIGSQLLSWTTNSSFCGQLKWGFFQPSGKNLEQMLQYAAGGRLRSFTDSVFNFDQVPQAFSKLQAKGVRGKIVVQVSPIPP